MNRREFFTIAFTAALGAFYRADKLPPITVPAPNLLPEQMRLPINYCLNPLGNNPPIQFGNNFYWNTSQPVIAAACCK